MTGGDGTKVQTISYVHDLLQCVVRSYSDDVRTGEQRLNAESLTQEERVNCEEQLGDDRKALDRAKKMLADFERHEWQ